MTIDIRETLEDLFPNDRTALRALQRGHARFRALDERHHVLARQIYRIEIDIEPAADERLEELKKERLAVLDEMAGIIEQHRTAPPA